MNYFELNANSTKLDILHRSVGHGLSFPRRAYLYDRRKFRRTELIQRGPMWRYRNRQVMRKLDWSKSWWQNKVRVGLYRKVSRGL